VTGPTLHVYDRERLAGGRRGNLRVRDLAAVGAGLIEQRWLAVDKDPDLFLVLVDVDAGDEDVDQTTRCKDVARLDVDHRPLHGQSLKFGDVLPGLVLLLRCRRRGGELVAAGLDATYRPA